MSMEAKALEAIVCGACWPHGRGDEEKRCHWCGELDWPLHRYWTCRRLDHHPSEYVQRSQKLKDLFIPGAEIDWAMCLWARGMLPMSLGRVKKDTMWPEDVVRKQTANYARMAETAEDLATDGSGGPEYIPSEIRQAGAAVAIVDGQDHDEGHFSVRDSAVQLLAVPGRQTVPRAETWAAICANGSTKNSQHRMRHIWSDSQYTVNGANKDSLEDLRKGVNGDLWSIWEQEQDANTKVLKCKAHAEKEVLQRKIPIAVYLRNALADAAADAMGELAVTSEEGQFASVWAGRAHNIALRLAVIEAEVWERAPQLVPLSTIEPTLPEVPNAGDEAMRIKNLIVE